MTPMSPDVPTASASSLRVAQHRRRNVKLSIIMASYNEDVTVVDAVTSVLDQEFPCPVELVVVDDGSRTRVDHLLRHIDDDRLVVVRQPANFGKGAALRQGAVSRPAPTSSRRRRPRVRRCRHSPHAGTRTRRALRRCLRCSTGRSQHTVSVLQTRTRESLPNPRSERSIRRLY